MAATAEKPQPPIDENWLSAKLEANSAISDVQLEDMSSAGGLSGEMWRVKFTQDGNAQSMVYKRTKPDNTQGSQVMGYAREAVFYTTLGKQDEVMRAITPAIFWAEGNMETGLKQLLMEDLSGCIQSGYFFGPHSPLNYGKDLPALIAKANDETLSDPAVISTMAARTIARIHGAFWKDSGLLETPWLQGVEWVRGQGETAWRAKHMQSVNAWSMVKDADKVQWSDNTRACVESALQQVAEGGGEWEKFLARYETLGWSLVHGDFHPANMMVRPKTEDKEAELVLLDWEAVGVGSGPQELGQYMISHCRPEDRERCEVAVVDAYYDQLKEMNPGLSLTKEQCWTEYKHGGAGKWIWMLPLLLAMCPPPVAQYFHDQLTAFLDYHKITAADEVPPRL